MLLLDAILVILGAYPSHIRLDRGHHALRRNLGEISDDSDQIDPRIMLISTLVYFLFRVPFNQLVSLSILLVSCLIDRISRLPQLDLMISTRKRLDSIVQCGHHIQRSRSNTSAEALGIFFGHKAQSMRVMTNKSELA